MFVIKLHVNFFFKECDIWIHLNDKCVIFWDCVFQKLKNHKSCNQSICLFIQYLAFDKSSNNTSSSLRFCRTPIWTPGPGEETAAADIVLPTGEIWFGIDVKSWFLFADVRVFDPFNLVCSVTSTSFGDRCDVLFWAYVFDSLMPKSLLRERAPVHWK